MRHALVRGRGEVRVDSARGQTAVRRREKQAQGVRAGLRKCHEESREHRAVQSDLWEGDETGENYD